MKKQVLSFLLVLVTCIGLTGCDSQNTSSSEVSTESSVSQTSSIETSSQEIRQKVIDQLKEAQALLAKGSYKEAMAKAQQARLAYNNPNYTDNLNKTALNIILRAGRSLRYNNQEYMRRNVFFGTSSETLPLTEEIRAFFYDYTTRHTYYALPLFTAKPSLAGLVSYANAYYENPENNVTKAQVEYIAKKYFGGFSDSHQSVKNFKYQNDVYSATSKEGHPDSRCEITSLKRTASGDSIFYTASFDIYRFDAGNENAQYIESLKSEKAYKNMSTEEILNAVISANKVGKLAKTSSITVEFEVYDSGTELYFIIRSVK